ncbi:MAG: hypothetical protein ACTSRD_14430 [Promethearchaeota archaeon]
MKKNLQQYAIIGLVIILAAGFAPLSTADDLALTQNEFEVYMDSLAIENMIPIETGLPPLTNSKDTFDIDDRDLPQEIIETDLTASIVEFDQKSGNHKIINKGEL